MRSVVPIVICVLLVIGGSMLMTNGAVTTSVPATYAVADPAPPIPQGDVAKPQPPVVQQGLEVKASIPDGLLPLMPKTPAEPSLQDQLAALGRAGPVCPQNCLPAVAPKTCEPVNACDAVATADREEGSRQPLRAVAQAGRGLLKVIVGHDRRAARREARRDG